MLAIHAGGRCKEKLPIDLIIRRSNAGTGLPLWHVRNIGLTRVMNHGNFQFPANKPGDAQIPAAGNRIRSVDGKIIFIDRQRGRGDLGVESPAPERVGGAAAGGPARLLDGAGFQFDGAERAARDAGGPAGQRVDRQLYLHRV